MKKKRIFIFSVGRSDYDRYFPIINQLHNSKKTKVYLLLSKSHYVEKLGSTYRAIEKKFRILKNDKMKSGYDLVERFSYDLFYIRKNIKKYKPDMIIVLGDRYEAQPSVLEEPVMSEDILSYEDKYMSEGGKKSGGMASLSGVS